MKRGHKPGCENASSSSRSADSGSSPPLPPLWTPGHEGSPPTPASEKGGELSSLRPQQTAPSLRGAAPLEYSSPRGAAGRRNKLKMKYFLVLFK